MTPDDDRLIILGSAVLWLLEKVPQDALSEQVLAFLDTFLDDAGERALFNFGPLPDGNDKVTPLKPFRR